MQADEVGQMRRLTVALCSSQQEKSFVGLKRLLLDRFPDQIERVDVIALPYNDLDSYRLDSSVDVVILLHSIYNRRFAITDVEDALYDKFLPKAKSLVGLDMVGVIVHDFDRPDTKEAKSNRMAAFRSLQPLTFECSAVVITCGKLGDQGPEIDDEDVNELGKFLKNARHVPAKVPEPGPRSHTDWRFAALCLIGAMAFVLIGFRLFKSTSVNSGSTASDNRIRFSETEL